MKKSLMLAIVAFIPAAQSANIDCFLPHEFWQNSEISKPVLTEALKFGAKQTANIDYFTADERDLDVAGFVCNFTYRRIIEIFSDKGIDLPSKAEFEKSIGYDDTILALSRGEWNKWHKFLTDLGTIIGKETARSIYNDL